MQNQRDEKPELNDLGSGRNLQGKSSRASDSPTGKEKPARNTTQLMEEVIERSNLIRALRRVERNGGAAGIDEMPPESLRDFLKVEWPKLKAQMLEGRYEPAPVRRVGIPKPGGTGMRQLGIPTVLDRFIQQALAQVLNPIFEGIFSESSYGFRPGRSAHQAVLKAQSYVGSGKRWVVDLDLEKFFDRVNHDLLMVRIAKKVEDKRVLRLIRKYLQAGLMEEGVRVRSEEGTPQGGPLSPLLSNILLHDLDLELEKRGHSFCRYADDCNIYVESKRAGERTLKSVTQFLERKLKLKVNPEKSAVGRPWERKFLGYSMTKDMKPRLKVAEASVKRLKEKLKETFRRGQGRNLERFIQGELNPILRGWGNYFQLAEVRNTFEDLDQWMRRKLRQTLWKRWKRTHSRVLRLMRRGIEKARAWKSAQNGRGSWWNSGASHMNEAFPKRYFDQLGLYSLFDEMRRTHRAT